MPPLQEEPIRAELFGIERLEQHAESLAAAQRVMSEPGQGRRLLPRVLENGRVLRDAHRVIAKSIREERAITPAAEWLVDNFHLVDEQLREIRDDLPTGFYRELPKLADGPLAGYPRVYGVAWAFVAHTDSRFDPDALRRFVLAYQRVQPLTIGELWAVAITLRVVLVENLRRLAEAIVRGRAARQEADLLADDLLGLNGPAEPPATVLQRLEKAPLVTAFAVQLVQRLRDQDPVITPALLWLDRRLAVQGTTPDDIVRIEHQRQAAMNVTVRNVIMGMSLMSALDWAAFFESVSLVDEAFREGTTYLTMDFTTRDSYRHAIEELARGSGRSELEIARAAVLHAKRGLDERRQDPGFYLVGNGRLAFELALGIRAPTTRRLLRAYVAAAMPGYLGTLVILTAVILALPLLAAGAAGAGLVALLVLGLLAVVPASDLAIALLNRAATALVPPNVLPRLELRDGVPAHLRTMIVVPTMLSDPAAVDEQIERLEVHYLANPDGDLCFALLSDWTDAPSEHQPGDEETLAAAREGIARLNRLHGSKGGTERFLLFHRRRVWNPGERTWMGWERKRGKLHELNRLLRGATDSTFLTSEVPPGVCFVITLDADTRLPRGAATRLVGTMAHPLNRPRLDPGTGRVVEGYAVLQPRVTPPLPGGESSLYQRLSSGPCGVDPYAAAVSDVYQDLFGEGSYTGKGIYELDVFEAALAGRVPENTLLSHDLFEGVFARAGLVTDIELFEPAPSHYGVAAARQHRWARGDWQLLPWIIPRRSHAAMPLIGRWKMLDNLRRTLSAPAAFLILVAGWALTTGSPGVWTAFVLATIALPTFLSALGGLIPRNHDISKRSHTRAVARDLLMAASQTAFAITMLAHQAWLMSDAIVRTLVRMCVTRRNLLEWVTAAQAKAGLRLDLHGFYRRMAGGLSLAAAAAAVVAWGGLGAWPFALPFLLLWAASPAVARWISLPWLAEKTTSLSSEDARALRMIARRTWQFFATFVGPEDRGLPPDNVQEDPRLVVAHRTSPTNLGLYLLSTVAARDFGWLGLVDTVERLETTLGAMTGLEHFRGHLYNWYDTKDGRPLDPKYVSSVDSGNLAGHLIALGHACRDMIDQPGLGRAALAGIEDAVFLVGESARALAADRRPLTVTRQRLDKALAVLAAALETLPGTQAEWRGRLTELAAGADMVMAIARALVEEDPHAEAVLLWADALQTTVESHARDLDDERSATGSGALTRRLTTLIGDADAMVAAMDFGFLFDPLRKLFSIGYRVTDGSLDPSYYDLLASEARLTSFVAIAKGDVPVSHWFRLGRALTPVEQDSVLVSWSGSMFEYLMPALVMRAPAGSLLDQTCRLVVRRQITYGAERGVPWGVSESAYEARDRELTYQYSNFGVPGLGLQRGLGDDIVIAPYATALAAMIDPAAALRNFRRLAEAGASGTYGFYEALDYTASRLPEGTDVAVVRTYMAHHQGMLLVAIGNALHGGAMRARFHAEPIVQATELLLQERTPRDVAVARPAEDVTAAANVREFIPSVVRRFTSPHTPTPRAHLLSNGRYVVMITAAGSGYSRWRGLAITRWREDVTRDVGGTYVFLRDVESGESWSPSYQPSAVEPESYQVAFSEDRAEIARRDHGIAATLTVIVSPEDDAEVRRVSLTNLGSRPREIDVTSYAEIVLAPPASDAAHPAFSNLFVQTSFVPEADALLATRRPRARTETPIWVAHVVAVEGKTVGSVQWETDRARFLGRGHGIRTPRAVTDGQSLSNTIGAVLDPIVSLRRRVRLPPGESVHVTFTTLIAPSRDEAIGLADKYRDPATFERAATLAWTQAQVQLRHLGVGSDEAHLFQSLASRILYSDRTLRASPGVLTRHAGGPAALWAHGISGDTPIVLVRIDEPEDIGIVRQLLRAHEYWRMKQLPVDLVILNERGASYVQDLQSALETLLRTSQSAGSHEGQVPHGNVFILRADRVTTSQLDVLQAAARVVLSSRHGTLGEQVVRADRSEVTTAVPSRRPAMAKPSMDAPRRRPELQCFNGLGGFTAEGREYMTIMSEGHWTPAPWINVIANPAFGFQVSESGAGYTWSINSHENQLTAWSNDPVTDPPGETIYVRDEESGELWGPTALPSRQKTGSYVARHGQGYSRFEHVSHGVALELLQFVPLDDPIKVSRLTLTNESGRTRRLSVTAYVEWVLGVSRSAAAPFVVTEVDPTTRAMFARNTWSGEFGTRVAFADLGGAQTEWTGDRMEFLGRHGTLDRPAGLAGGSRLSGRVGAGFDPCSALRAMVELRAGGHVEVVFLLGEAATRDEARELIARYRTRETDAALRAVAKHWDDVLGGVQVTTPDRSMDMLLNRWLLYQTLACRVWARSAFYQAGGAYGFRDQLQDVMALTVSRPDVAREHVLRAAARQFVEGDVQHWWHPPAGRGVRTRISDDRLWLPYVVKQYVETTGDWRLLDEVVPFLEGPLLAAEQSDSYFEPRVAEEQASVFEHCARALDCSLSVGSHGLPLMGTGDWNDGMNLVGAEGKGESVWLAWFLHPILSEWAAVAEARGEGKRATTWRGHASALKESLEREAWDGGWYRRAYFDDGTPLGSAVNDACRIDSIAQSWSVISGGTDAARSKQAMSAVDETLVRRGNGLVLLLTPPFDGTPLEPGYIKGYPPGVRENGGQYTHAAIWSIIAFATQGDGDKAAELFALMNPINHASTPAAAFRYKVEPYVVAGDVYAEPPHVGRGGWTWYTGAAGWMYRAGLEWILGFRLRDTRLLIDPCIPRTWPGFTIAYRHQSARYDVVVENPRGVSRGVSLVELDGVAVTGPASIPLADDDKTHRIRVVLG